MREWGVLPSRVHNPTNTPVASWAIRFPLEFDLIDVVHRNGAKALCSLCHITRVALHGTGFSGYGRRDDARELNSSSLSMVVEFMLILVRRSSKPNKAHRRDKTPAVYDTIVLAGNINRRTTWKFMVINQMFEDQHPSQPQERDQSKDERGSRI